MSQRPPVHPRRRLVAWLVLGCAVATVAVIAWSRSQNAAVLDGRPWSELSRKEQDELSKSSFASLSVRPITQLTRAEVLETLKSLDVRSAPSPSIEHASRADGSQDVASRAALIQLASEFLHHLFVQDDPAAYRAWRTSLGYTLVPAPLLIDVWTVPADYQTIFKEPYPGDDHFAEVFDTFWAHARAMPTSRVLGVCEGPGAAFVAFGQVAATNPGTWPSPRNARGMPVWVGSASLTNRNWWSPPHEGYAALLTRRGTLRVAVVGLVLEFADEVRAPVLVRFYQDGADDTWWIRDLIVQNPPTGRDMTVIEF